MLKAKSERFLSLTPKKTQQDTNYTSPKGENTGISSPLRHSHSQKMKVYSSHKPVSKKDSHPIPITSRLLYLKMKMKLNP